MNTGISLTTDLISKSDDSLGKNSLFNPSSITDKLFEIRNLFSHDFMDICCTLLLIITILIVKKNFISRK